MGKVVEGYNCSVCEKYHEFSPYVYAHTMDELKHRCDCGALHIIINLKARLYSEIKKKRSVK